MPNISDLDVAPSDEELEAAYDDYMEALADDFHAN